MAKANLLKQMEKNKQDTSIMIRDREMALYIGMMVESMKDK